MPIILKGKNVPTDLKIANGARGIVRKILTTKCDPGLTYATSAFVEFPGSPIHPPQLPAGCIHVRPVMWSLTVADLLMPDGTKMKARIKRFQTPSQPAFAVTGHLTTGRLLRARTVYVTT